MKRFLALGCMLPFLTGCATLLSGGPSALTLSVDEPQGAAVVVQQLPSRMQVGSGRNELVLSLDRRFDYHALVSSPGYQPVATVIHREIQPSFWGNLALGIGGGLGGLVAYQVASTQGNGLGSLLYLTFVSFPAVGIGALGAVTDYATGNMWTHAAPPPVRLRRDAERPEP